MKNFTDTLEEEHKKILENIESFEKSDFSFLEFIEFIENFADKTHHLKEENILFKKISEKTAEMACGPVQQMLYEHDMGRDLIKKAKEGLTKNDKKGVLKNLLIFCALLKEHISKENNILYPMADQLLAAKKQEELVKTFDKLELEQIGPGKHEEFHQLLQTLHDSYS